MTMKILLAVLACALLGACAIAERDITEVGDQIQEGLRGGGRIVERDPTNDSFGPEFR